MKKVFAFLSTLLLTIAFVGIFAVSKPATAANKITVDPTLAEDEIPVYVMNSIYTTFPNYYDNDAKADENWPGPSRMYPWNETRLRVAQLDEEGNPTGKYYAVYFAGHTVAVDEGEVVVGAGKNILFWDVDANGNVGAVKASDGAITSGGQASDPSLSHMRTNISGKDITFDPTKVYTERYFKTADGNEYKITQSASNQKWYMLDENGSSIKDENDKTIYLTEEELATTYFKTGGLGDEGSNFYNRSIVFDAQGRIIRAVGLDGIYNKATGAEGEQVITPEFCYVDGVVTKMEEDTVCDKLKVQAKDENGEPLVDEETGEPVYEESDELNLLYSRFVYEYFTEKPENVNTVPYLSEGWTPALWDYCFEEGDGWVCIAFVGSADGTQHKIKGDQVTAYIKTLVAEGKTEEEATEIANATVRECTREYRIPAGGWTFDYGYLDRGTGNDVFFNDTVIKGYKYGRNLIEDKGMACQRTYNFSVTGLFFREKVVDEQSYQLLNGQNVVEIMQGTEYKPAQNIVYDGIMRYWGTPNDLTSYTASAEALEFYISEGKNGANAATVVQPPQSFQSQEEMAAAFIADWNEYAAEKFKDDATKQINGVPKADWTDEQAYAFYDAIDWDMVSTSNNTEVFLSQEKYWTKWSWMFDYIYNNANEGDKANIQIQGDQEKGRFVASPGSFRISLFGFLAESPQRSVPNTWAHTCGDWSNGNATKWIDKTTSLDLWKAYTLDATMAAPNDNWVVNYKVVNTATGVSSDITIKYVVVDSYTPIIKVDANKLLYIPKVVSDLVVCNPIDPYTIVSAFDAQYNGVSILGNDISQNIEFDTELNFANPKEGIWPVVATIYNNAATKKAVVKFNIEIRDITAPNAVVRKVYVQAGDNFDPRDGIVLAVDNVDGDLTKQAYTWWQEESKPFDTSKVTNDTTYTVKVTIFDKAGNERTLTYSVVVVADKAANSAALKDLAEKVDELGANVQDIVDTQADLNDAVAELQDAVAELSGLKADVEGLKTAVAGVKTDVENAQTSLDDLEENVEDLVDLAEEAQAIAGQKCGKNATALVLEIAGAAALLAFVLRKRH